ncbi:MAG TPA: methyltransferase domain-containing protein, partial [Burkholderiaceae bacterium]|nr:methyltransferase domain-containing protein [Burkholderiaceae bacterium]
LTKQFRRFGIEISEDARRVAESRAVEIVGAKFEELPSIGPRFDAVLACDVIEHHPRPREFLAQCLSAVKPGGLLLLTTGNPDAALWRFARGNFWYCQFIEHLTFITPRWLRMHAQGCSVVAIRKFAYGKLTAVQKLKTLARLLHYHVAPKSYARRVARIRRWQGPLPYCPNPPGMGMTRDHFIAVLRKR